jgi:uncharacterized radical SAM superfamily Fe-S cluster-containing enzyme
MLLVNEQTRQAVPLADILDTDRLLADLKIINERHRPRGVMVAEVLLSLMRNFRYERAPQGLGMRALLKVFDGHTGRHMGMTKQARHPWRVLLIAGMWFQDLFNYDFRRTEMCIIPYATQMGEISFCAYNTGMGWRQIVERLHMNATTAEWFKTRGRHAIYAGGKAVPLASPAGSPFNILQSRPTQMEGCSIPDSR